MKTPIVSVFGLLAVAAIHAADLGSDVNVMPPPGWKSVQPFSPLLAPSPYATLKYVPADGRHAAVTITLVPADVLGFAVRDFPSLSKFTLIAAQPFLPADEPAPRVVEHGLPAGLATWVTAICPAPPQAAPGPETYRMATTASLLLDSNHLVHFTILHDGDNVSEFRQAVDMIRTVHLREVPATAMGGPDSGPLRKPGQ